MGLAQTFLPFPPHPAVPPPAVQIFNTGEASAGRQFSQELRIASNGTQKLDYLAGLFYSDYSADTSFIAPGGAFNVGFFLFRASFFPSCNTATDDDHDQ